MTTEQNKTVARRFFRAFETNDQAALADLLSPDLAANHPGAPEPMSRSELLRTIDLYHAAFSDQRYDIQLQVAEGDKVATRVVWHATHSGDFQGVPASGKQVAVSGTAISRIQNGEIVERWLNMDQMGLMQQLGLVPAR